MERGRIPSIRGGLDTRLAAGASAAVLAFGMAGESSQGVAGASSQPTPSTFEFGGGTSSRTQLAVGSLAATQCGLRYVQPNKYFNHDNKGLSKQVALINGLYNTEITVKISDIWTAAQIVRASNQDPRYARAMERTRNSAAKGSRVNRTTFLGTRPSTPKPCGDKNHISKAASSAQIRRTSRTGQDLVRRVGSGLGERAGRATKAAYERLKSEVEKFADQRP